MSRRSFLKAGAVAAAALTASPAEVLAAKAGPATVNAGKLKLLLVGVGGRGAAVIKEMETEEFIGIADCDWAYAKPVIDKYKAMFPNMKVYKDYKVMYAELLDQCDAVVCATSDHTHAIIAAEAMAAGKHVYVEKPLTRTVYEARLMTKMAAKYGVATQMGNQGASSIGTKLTIDYLRGGAIGAVTRVDAFTDRPIWPQGLERPEGQDKLPKTLDWNAFIGPAPMRPFKANAYTPWNFRGWWDFGTGA
ncbi:MAG: Gfo/Idh/MocA family oxidoreductase, partial [Bacteroidaceae bacterium]|nr:Gfo/Idh/MocA family oxidoreductase [Bacteroidaceae bacterium]